MTEAAGLAGRAGQLGSAQVGAGLGVAAGAWARRHGAGVRGGRSGRAGVLRRRRLAPRCAWQAGAGHAGRARPRRWARAGQGCAIGALRLVFNPVFRLGIFPESLNEHCSL